MSMPNPIVLLDARARYVHPSVQVQRSTPMTGYDADGRRRSWPANSAVWEYLAQTGHGTGLRTALASENMLLHSNDFAQSQWQSGSVSLTPGAAVGVDGTQSMTRMERLTDLDGQWRALYQSVSPSGYPVAVSADLKADTTAFAAVRLHGVSAQAGVGFDLISGQAIRVDELEGGTVVAHGSEYLGDGIFRCWASFSLPASETAPIVRYHLVSETGSLAVTSPSGVLIGHAQAEQNMSPTPYIGTAGATSQRLATRLLVNNLASQPWWRRDKGTLVVDGQQYWPEGFSRFIDFGSAMDVHFTGGGLGNDRIVFSGSDVGVSNEIVIPSERAKGRHVIALAWDGEGVSVVADGYPAFEGARVAMGEISTLGLFSRANLFLGVINGYGYRAVYYPQRLPNAVLQSLTAIQE